MNSWPVQAAMWFDWSAETRGIRVMACSKRGRAAMDARKTTYEIVEKVPFAEKSFLMIYL